MRAGRAFVIILLVVARHSVATLVALIVALPATAESERLPVKVSLVLDVSRSVEREGIFDDVKQGARAFVARFDAQTDRVGLIDYYTTAHERTSLKGRFKRRMFRAIDALEIQSDTNVEEALRTAKRQIDRTPDRPRVSKVIVLFNGGPSTAFSARFEMFYRTDPFWYRGAVASYITGSSYRGLFRLSDGAKVVSFDARGRPVTVPNASTRGSPAPRALPGSLSVSGTNIRRVAAERSEARARWIRSKGYTIYVVGFLNRSSSNVGDIPDPSLWRRIANDDGIANPDQPIGNAVVVTDPAHISDAFTRVADAILRSPSR